VSHKSINRIDRAVCENDEEGFIKIVHNKTGKLLGATIVAAQAGEMITEIAMGLKRGLKLIDLANFIHVYPTYSVGTMQVAGEVTVDSLLTGLLGKVFRVLARGRL
jgi:pyruvate/2-oxoglutarate dehydrogenase complex dihydrolipoamide dehydrogenase (E3) component